MGANNWENLLLNDPLREIVQRLEYLEDIKSFSSVCKAWNSVASEWMETEKPMLPSRNPWLLLAEDTGADLSSVVVGSLEPYRFSVNEDEDSVDEDEDSVDEDEDEDEDSVDEDVDVDEDSVDENEDEDSVDEDSVDVDVDEDEDAGDDGHNQPEYAYDEQKAEVDRTITSIGDLFKNISSIRGLFSLKTRKTYHLDLPEATDKLILGTNKGCLVTLGRDLEINLLHPLLRYQISLPPMLTFPCQYNYDDDFFPQLVYDMFIAKVVMSSIVPTKSALQNHDTSHLPIVMAIYGEFRTLGFARLGDHTWQDVEISSRVFEDIVYHKGDFYGIDCHGSVFLCDIEKEQKEGRIITSIPIEKGAMDQSYLIESLCGSHLWLVLRIWSGEYFGTTPGPYVDLIFG